MRRAARWLLFLLGLSASGSAHAYPFMIRHGYTQCSSCHTDPSGGTFLNEYGRAQSELLLSSFPAGSDDASDDVQGEPTAGRFLGFIPLPSWFRPGGWVREGYIWNAVDGKIVDRRALQMRADLGVDVKIGAFRAAAQLGYGSPEGTPRLAQITHSTTGPNLVGREFWAGVETFGGDGLLRAGRINVPFGLRNLEHTSFVRTATQTDFNEDQTYGVAFAISRPTWRAEVMALLGNLSVHPDAYRERGLAGYLELSASPTTAFGISALAARSDASLTTHRPTLRQAYGGFARLAPWRPLVFQLEADLVLQNQLGSGIQDVGHAEWLQADLEFVRGLHLFGALEGMKTGSTPELQRGAWGGVWWFVIPHLDVRADVVERWGEGPPTTTFLVQLNGYL
ncbi:MAG TPA: hypothetical protein VFI53_01295 [Myxococcaceae bacterium]|nr:hypothetical protein [Myxococcaceae bacterium]